MVQVVHKISSSIYIIIYILWYIMQLSLFFNVAPTDSPSGTGDGTDATLPSGAPPTVAAGALFVATASFIAALL